MFGEVQNSRGPLGQPDFREVDVGRPHLTWRDRGTGK